MLGFGTTMRFIWKGGRYGSILASCKIVSRLSPCDGSNPSIGDANDVGCISLAGVVPSNRTDD